MRKDREGDTVITIMVGLLILYAIFSYHWMWMTALAVGVAAVLSPSITRLIHIIWFWIGQKLGFVMSNMILGALFVVVLLPLAFLANLFRKDFMLIRKKYDSFFVERRHVYQRGDLEKPW